MYLVQSACVIMCATGFAQLNYVTKLPISTFEGLVCKSVLYRGVTVWGVALITQSHVVSRLTKKLIYISTLLWANVTTSGALFIFTLPNLD